MKKTLIAALGLIAALAFTAPAFEAGSALATTPATTATTAATKEMKKATHHVECKTTKTHKCPVHHAKKKKPATPAY